MVLEQLATFIQILRDGVLWYIWVSETSVFLFCFYQTNWTGVCCAICSDLQHRNHALA